jgi:hypothetical protein
MRSTRHCAIKPTSAQVRLRAEALRLRPGTPSTVAGRPSSLNYWAQADAAMIRSRSCGSRLRCLHMVPRACW